MQLPHKPSIEIYALIVALSIVIFFLDLATPIGYAPWVLYVIPVALCVKQPYRQAPVVTGLLMCALITLGYFVSKGGTDTIMVIANRTAGICSVLGTAYLVFRIIDEHGVARRLLWLQRGKAEINRSAQGEHDSAEIGKRILAAMARHLGAQVARLYHIEDDRLIAIASFAGDRPPADIAAVAAGQGLVGEVAQSGQPIVIGDLPPDYLPISSGIGRGAPRRLLLAPIRVEQRTTGVIELGFAGTDLPFSDMLELMEMAAEPIGIALRSAAYRRNLRRLLEETQRQSEELQQQQEELRVSNEELEEQSRVLRESQTRLESQQTELEEANVQLEEHAQQLQAQKQDLLDSQRALQRNAEELARANQYKSEFLANMSHELRTPLNSSLILSQILADNRTGNLTDEQIRYARTIHSSNNALLALINDILDLSKIEAGHMDVHAEPVGIAGIIESMQHLFEPLAKEKHLGLHFGISADAPETLVTDSQRLQQILKNLLSNALKFTSNGEVTLHVAPAANGKITFSVRDTGIGIPEPQQQVIFEAFRQADGTTSRKYGGTGLGLTISRQLARLLGGTISLQSAAGLGSTFTLEIPAELSADMIETKLAQHADAISLPAAEPVMDSSPRALPAVEAMTTEQDNEDVGPHHAGMQPIADDRDRRSRDKLILIIEDDTRFASVLYDLAHERDFDCIHAANAAQAIALARKHRPHGILLDVGLPDQSGLNVLERLKRDPVTRHIPIHMVSVDDHMQTALELGAVGYALKPVAREDLLKAIEKLESKLQDRTRRVLIVEDNIVQRDSLAQMLKADDIDIVAAGTVGEALAHVSESTFDCMVTDLILPDATGYELLEKMAEGGRYSFPPVIVYTGRSLTRDEEQRLRRYSQSIIIKGAKSPERLLDEVTLFLHRVETSLPAAQQKLLQQARQRDAGFEGRTILLAEDDVRNIFALSSVLEPLGATLEIARNGKEAIGKLESGAAVDLVLMDLMMPEMDGLTAIREIRKRPALAKTPIIALTAKAMTDDRKSCLDAGANDYIAKPIDVEKLVSLCRVWMPK